MVCSFAEAGLIKQILIPRQQVIFLRDCAIDNAVVITTLPMPAETPGIWPKFTETA
tara:strand:- start:6977 stop:7144 length:168 start_codon:yes stop_codon:yes gene_type:complete